MRITESQLRRIIKEELLAEGDVVPADFRSGHTRLPATVLYDQARGGWEYELGGFANWPEFLQMPKAKQIAWAKDYIGAGINEPVEVTVYADGHVKFEDGHHRVLAGALLGIEIPVKIEFRNFDPALWPDLYTLLKAGYTHRQYNPQQWKLNRSGVPPLDVVRHGPDAADEWIMSSETRITESQLRRIIKEELDSNVETIQRMLRLDPWTFDQTPAGWSSLPADMQIDAMRAYVEGPLARGQKTKAPGGRRLDPRTIIWHLGQVLAMRDQPGDRKEAIGWMMKSLKSADRQWNDYVKATIAFLSGDRESFDKHSTGENYNSDVLDRLRDGWGRSYSEVY